MNQETLRPNPDELLHRLNAQAERENRPKLKIFFGFAPGVGKTYRMLQAARELVQEKVDVVIGAVETHGRVETNALLASLECLPRKKVDYRGHSLEEFDLDAALARKPKVLLLDELAHTNAPGSRHAKRWQDVLELLEAGIDVYTTLNVQHVESLNDVVAQITHVQVRETVPDSILERADEIEVVDISAEELLDRLREGKVYLGEQATRAAQHFFQRGNLLALRELALRRTAERVDADVLAHRKELGVRVPWAMAERMLVCVGPSPGSARLVRATRRMAAGLRAPWVAAYVDSSALKPMSQEDRLRLEANLRLAESLGASVVRLTGPRISSAVLEYAQEHNITRLIIGKPTHSRLRDFLHGSLLDEIVRGSGEMEVHVISGDRGESSPTKTQRRQESESFEPKGYVWANGVVILATAFAWMAKAWFAPSDLVMLYMLGIMVVAAQLRRGPAIFASALSVAAYNFFFVPPLFTFAVAQSQHVLTFVMMFGVGLLISALTLRIRRQELSAHEREARTVALYTLSRELAAAVDESKAAQVLAQHASHSLGSGVAVLLATNKGELTIAADALEIPFGAAEQGVAKWVFEHRRPAGFGTDTLPGASVACFPIQAGTRLLGVFALSPKSSQVLEHEPRNLLEAFIRQGALALERAHLAEEAKAAALKARTEEMRSSLLSAVSHDLRTPLAAITGAATTLSDGSFALEPNQRKELLDAILEEAERLERLVGNLLDMTRLDSGGLRMKREWVPLDELISSALTRLDKKLGKRRVLVDIAVEVPLLHLDPVLFEQVFINLLENATKYTPADSAIDIVAALRNGSTVIEVKDQGPGLPKGSEQKVFEKFYRGAHVGISGVGLGLSICKGVVDAHDGTLQADNRAEGGAVFRITLPVTDQAPVVGSETPLRMEEARA